MYMKNIFFSLSNALTRWKKSGGLIYSKQLDSFDPSLAYWTWGLRVHQIFLVLLMFDPAAQVVYEIFEFSLLEHANSTSSIA